MEKYTQKVLVCVPNLGQINQITVKSLLTLYETEHTDFYFKAQSLIYTAREEMANAAIDEGYDYLLFIDSDIEFPPDALYRLLDKNCGMVTGIYYQRGAEHLPVICRKMEPFNCEIETDVDREDLIPIVGCGMGFCLIKTEWLKEVRDKYGKGTMFCPEPGLGEDFAFCKKVNELNHVIFADPTIPLNHWGNIAYGRASFNKEKYEQQCSD